MNGRSWLGIYSSLILEVEFLSCFTAVLFTSELTFIARRSCHLQGLESMVREPQRGAGRSWPGDMDPGG